MTTPEQHTRDDERDHEAIPATPGTGAQLLKTIEHIKRLSSSVNGNPRWELIFTDGSVHKMTPDASDSYAIGNPGLREGSKVAVTFGKRGNIYHIRPA